MKFVIGPKQPEETVEVTLESTLTGGIELLLSRPGGQRFVLGRFSTNSFHFIKATATKFGIDIKEN